MLPEIAPKPKEWTDEDKLCCIARWLDALAIALYDWTGENKTGIPCGEKGDPCFECPAGDRCPAWCDTTHLKRYTEFYAFENFRLIEQQFGMKMPSTDTILKEICEANTLTNTSQA